MRKLIQIFSKWFDFMEKSYFFSNKRLLLFEMLMFYLMLQKIVYIWSLTQLGSEASMYTDWTTFSIIGKLVFKECLPPRSYCSLSLARSLALSISLFGGLIVFKFKHTDTHTNTHSFQQCLNSLTVPNFVPSLFFTRAGGGG